MGTLYSYESDIVKNVEWVLNNEEKKVKIF